MKLYVTRHGETELNASGRVSGLDDVPLTGRGRAQAEALARAAQGKGIDLVITSPLRRARETAATVAAALDVPLETEPCLRELDYGSYDRAPIDLPEFRRVKRLFAWRMGGGESILDVAARVYPFLDRLRERCPDRAVLLVCHGTVCRVIHSYFRDLTNEEFWASIPDNCQLRAYEW